MKDHNIQITTFERAIAIFRPNNDVLNQAIKFLGEFQRSKKMNEQNMHTLAQIAVFVATSSQQIYDTRGKGINSLGLLISRLIGNIKIPISSLLSKLALFAQTVSVEHRYQMQLRSYMQKIQKAIWEMETLLNFIGIMDFELIQQIRNTNYKQIYIELGWLIYIDCKQNHFEEQALSYQAELCLMASVCYFLIRYSLDYAYPTSLKSNRNCDKRVVINKILQLLLDLFQIQNIETYKQIANNFDEYAEKLINNRVFRALSSEIDFFSPYIIYFNYKQLQNKYQKQLKPQSIDYRLIRKQRSTTPINKQALLYKLEIKRYENLQYSRQRVYQSHKLLNYKESQMQSDNTYEIKMQQNKDSNIVLKMEIEKERKNCLSSVLPDLTSLNQDVNFEIYNYLKNVLLKEKQLDGIKNSDELLKIKRILCKNLNDNELLFLTTKSVFEVLSKQIKHQSRNIQIVKDCVLALSIFIIMELHNKNNERTIIDYLESTTYLHLINSWYCLQFLMKSQKNMPFGLKKTFSLQSERIICQTIWKDTQYLDQLAQLAANYQKDEIFNHFSTSVLMYCENFISKISHRLLITQLHCNAVYNCLKFILSANGDILIGRHLDQIIICSIYIAGKSIGEPILFSNLKQAYQILWGNNQKKYQKVFIGLSIQEDFNGSIIDFYNKKFIQSIKPFLPYMCNPSLNLLHPLFQRKLTINEHNMNTYSEQTNQMNLLETRKPKPPSNKCSKSQQMLKIQNALSQINRNQTRARVRPQCINQKQLCETQRIKQYQL